MSYNNPAVRGPLRLKVDTGAGGNTLPLRTYHQMFGNTPTNKIFTPEPAAKLTPYSGHSIPCRGSIVLQLSKPSGQSQSHRFYVVDVPGPAILGLPSCNKLNIYHWTLNQPHLECLIWKSIDSVPHVLWHQNLSNSTTSRM